ncbi:MAG: hypothetical protein ACR2KT_11195 [Methylocella sp.]|nr:MAG: hypothetical protein DLM68_02335 [Hyphomicrobiales bacterium]
MLWREHAAVLAGLAPLVPGASKDDDGGGKHPFDGLRRKPRHRRGTRPRPGKSLCRPAESSLGRVGWPPGTRAALIGDKVLTTRLRTERAARGDIAHSQGGSQYGIPGDFAMYRWRRLIENS